MMLEEAGFSGVEIGPPVDTFGGAGGEAKARAYEVYGYAFLARRTLAMPRETEAEVLDRMSAWYSTDRHGVFERIETSVIGADYGANGYTTNSQVDRLVRLLGLTNTDRVLDVGTGCGWPALYMANQVGCDVVGTDLPLEGLRVARRRIRADGLDARATVACARAEALPFGPQSFNAIVHTDVLC